MRPDLVYSTGIWLPLSQKRERFRLLFGKVRLRTSLMENKQPYFRCIGHFANIIWNKQFSYFLISWVVSVLYTWLQCGISWSVSVVESAAGVVASAKTGAEMIEDSSKLFLFPPDHPPGTLRPYFQTLLQVLLKQLSVIEPNCESPVRHWTEVKYCSQALSWKFSFE